MLFAMQRSSSYSNPPTLLATSMKIKALIRDFVFSKLSYVTRVLTKSKTFLSKIMEDLNLNKIHKLVPLIFKKNKTKNKLYLGSFRFHYNGSSSHMIPKSAIHDGSNGYHVYYDPKWSSLEDGHLSSYLHWLEEKNDDTDHEIIEIDIDGLAEKFIAESHEKFILEKQESERKFQEMMARSL